MCVVGLVYVVCQLFELCGVVQFQVDDDVGCFIGCQFE